MKIFTSRLSLSLPAIFVMLLFAFAAAAQSNTTLGYPAEVTKADLTIAAAGGAGATASTINTVALGRGADTVLIPGKLRLDTVSLAPGVALCRGTTPASRNQIVDCSVSSRRYKTNITPFLSGLSLIAQLRPIRFEWKDGGLKDVGYGAEEVAAVEPLLATYNEKGEVEGVKYDRISTVLVNAVKEQQAQIEAQQLQIKQQQAALEGLKKLLCGQNPSAEVCRK